MRMHCRRTGAQTFQQPLNNIAMNLVRIKKNRNDMTPFFSAFDDMFARPMDERMRDTGGTSNRPAVNIKETDTGFAIEVAAPGLRKEDFTVDVDKDVLTIRAERETKEATTENEGRYTRREFGFTSFSRSFTLPETVHTDNIQAAYEHGILTLTLPKREEALPKPARAIEIA